MLNLAHSRGAFALNCNTHSKDLISDIFRWKLFENTRTAVSAHGFVCVTVSTQLSPYS